MDLQTELCLAFSIPSQQKEEKKYEDPIMGRYYDIDQNTNYNVPVKTYVGVYFYVQSDCLTSIKSYYLQTFGINFEDEQDLQRRVNNPEKQKMYRVIDPNHRSDYVNITKLKDWCYIDHKYRIISNNSKLFDGTIKRLVYDNGGTMARLGLLHLSEIRQFGKWYCLDIRKHIDFVANRQSDGIVSINIGEQTVYYSYIHKLWGMNWSNFKVIYRLLIGHDYSHQEIIIKRLEKTADGDEYAVIDEFNKRILKVTKQQTGEYNYISDDTRIVSNNELLFNNYLQVVPFYRRGYRLKLS